jgi:hypothetical protein
VQQTFIFSAGRMNFAEHQFVFDRGSHLAQHSRSKHGPLFEQAVPFTGIQQVKVFLNLVTQQFVCLVALRPINTYRSLGPTLGVDAF